MNLQYLEKITSLFLKHSTFLNGKNLGIEALDLEQVTATVAHFRL